MLESTRTLSNKLANQNAIQTVTLSRFILFFTVSLLLISLISISQLFIASAVFAEALWAPGSDTPPRNSDPLVNYKSAPCRDFTRTKRVKVYKPGDAILAQWAETRDHFGTFQFNLLRVNAATGADELVMKSVFANVNDTINGTIVGTQFHNFQQNFNLPTQLANGTAIASGDYVLQLVHLATLLNAPASPTNPAASYYSCSDIRLENANTSDVVSPDNVSNTSLTKLTDSIKLDWVNPVSNGVVTENLAYKVLLLVDQVMAITVTQTQLANKEYRVGDVVLGSTKVAYVGNGEAFTQLISGNGNYSFKIFAYDVNANYSSGVDFSGSKVRLSVVQGNNTDASLLKVNNGNITVTAVVTSSIANERFSYKWTQTNIIPLADTDGNVVNDKFVIDSTVLAVGNYSLLLKATSSVTRNVITVSQNLNLTTKDVTSNPGSSAPAATEKQAGGCSVGSTGTAFDPVLLLLALLSLIVITTRRLGSIK